MRIWNLLPVLGISLATLGGAAFGQEGEAGSDFPARQVEGQAPSLNPSEFQLGQPLGGFQPTDVGGEAEEPSAGQPGGPEPPAALSPSSEAGPVRGAGQSFQFNDSSQSVAPAQFQTPANPKTQAEPKTTIVPAAAAPALQPPPSNQTPENAPEPQNLSQSLYQQSLAPPQAGAVAGTPLSLPQALVRRTNPARYAEFVKAYWKLSQSLGDYHDALQGAAELAQLPQPRVPHQQALLQAAVAAAEAEVRNTRLQAVSSQWELAEQMSGNASRPLPQDAPLMTAYKSKFEAVFAGRTPPAGARRLHETFDDRLALIEARASAVVAAENAFGAAADAYANGQLDLAMVLREHDHLQNARREFLASVYRYNAAIADYAYLAAGPNRSPETIASMLVDRKRPAAKQEAATANFIAP